MTNGLKQREEMENKGEREEGRRKKEKVNEKRDEGNTGGHRYR